MCVLSFIGDQYGRDFPDRWPQIPLDPGPAKTITFPFDGVSQKDFDVLKKEVEELKILLLAAKRFDEETGQADCEMDEKVWFIRRLAEYVGVDVDEVFGRQE